MLMAVEMWVKRDHDAEWKRWTAWLDHIAQRLSSIAGVTTTVVQPNGLSNRTPSLRIQWDRQKLGLAGDAVVRALLEGNPRIATAAAGGAPPLTGVSVTPYMMDAGDERIVADRLHALLSKPARDSRRRGTHDAGRRSRRPVERQHPVRRGEGRAHAAADAARQRPRRVPSGRVRHA